METTEHKHKLNKFYWLNQQETIKTCFRVCFWMEMEVEDEKDKETYVVGELGIVHATWRMLASRWVCCRHLRTQECTQDKTRREEDTSLSHSLTNLVEVLYSQNQSYHFKDLSLPFIMRTTGHKYKGCLQEKLWKVTF